MGNEDLTVQSEEVLTVLVPSNARIVAHCLLVRTHETAVPRRGKGEERGREGGGKGEERGTVKKREGG